MNKYVLWRLLCDVTNENLFHFLQRQPIGEKQFSVVKENWKFPTRLNIHFVMSIDKRDLSIIRVEIVSVRLGSDPIAILLVTKDFSSSAFLHNDSNPKTINCMWRRTNDGLAVNCCSLVNPKLVFGSSVEMCTELRRLSGDEELQQVAETCTSREPRSSHDANIQYKSEACKGIPSVVNGYSWKKHSRENSWELSIPFGVRLWQQSLDPKSHFKWKSSCGIQATFSFVSFLVESYFGTVLAKRWVNVVINVGLSDNVKNCDFEKENCDFVTYDRGISLSMCKR